MSKQNLKKCVTSLPPGLDANFVKLFIGHTDSDGCWPVLLNPPIVFILRRKRLDNNKKLKYIDEYARFQLNGWKGSVSLSRLIYIINKGDIPQYWLWRKCSDRTEDGHTNHPCLNPDHYYCSKMQDLSKHTPFIKQNAVYIPEYRIISDPTIQLKTAISS